MQAKEDDFSPQESLKLATQIIEAIKNSISDRSHYFLLWEWAYGLNHSWFYFECHF